MGGSDRDAGLLGQTLTRLALDSSEPPVAVELARQLVRSDLLGSVVYLRLYDEGSLLNRETFARVLGRDCLLLGLVASLWTRLEAQVFPRGQFSLAFADRLLALEPGDWWRDQARKAVLADPKTFDEGELWLQDLLEHLRRAGVYRSVGLLDLLRQPQCSATFSELRVALLADQAVARLLRRSLLAVIGSTLHSPGPARPGRRRPARPAPLDPPPPPPRSLKQIFDDDGPPPSAAPLAAP